MCNSPRNPKTEAMIILRNCDLLENYTVTHMKHSKLSENFYQSDGLELIGTINDPLSFDDEAEHSSGTIGVSFQLLFYKRPHYHKLGKFNFTVEIVYEDIN
jgi:hypothetical protein